MAAARTAPASVIGGPSQVSEGLAGMRAAADVAVQDLAREPPPSEAEGQGQRKDEAAEGDAEGDQHHLLPDAQVRDGGGRREEEHRPPDHPCKQPCLRHMRVDGRDEHTLREEIRDEPADEENQPRPEDAGEGIENEVGHPPRARNGEGVDGEGDRDDEDAPEHHEAEYVGGCPPDARPPHRLAQSPGLGTAVEAGGAGEPSGEAADQPSPTKTDGSQGEHGEEPREDHDQPRGDVVDGRPHQIAPRVRHGGSSFDAAHDGAGGAGDGSEPRYPAAWPSVSSVAYANVATCSRPGQGNGQRMTNNTTRIRGCTRRLGSRACRTRRIRDPRWREGSALHNHTSFCSYWPPPVLAPRLPLRLQVICPCWSAPLGWTFGELQSGTCITSRGLHVDGTNYRVNSLRGVRTPRRPSRCS